MRSSAKSSVSAAHRYVAAMGGADAAVAVARQTFEEGRPLVALLARVDADFAIVTP